MRSAVGRVALLLFGSGFCALVYQTAWLRLFRLIFGASTAASAAVLAIFMAGLGFGGLLLGKRADRHPSPLGLYAGLEAGIAISAGLSPLLLALVEWLYVAMGGSARLGLAGSSAVRLLLSLIVLGLPTFLMGGTLPAVARAVERRADFGRRVVGLLYAVNTLGAGLGALLTTSCSLEALLIALPFALGDQIAVLAALLRPLAGAGFVALVGGVTAVGALVGLPPALVGGYQFPLLIALLGSGRRRVGREVGVTYAANTLGAILGSIAGGFGLIPLLTAQGVWRLVALLLLALAAVAILADLRAGRRAGSPRRAAFLPVAAGIVGLLFCAATGPTAFWRHTPIGAGRLKTADWNGPNDVRNKVEDMRQRIVWQADGVESSVALDLADEYAFIVNGKSDGSALADAPTQVMSGLVGAILHPNPRRALVIGLGTGSTAGWLAKVPTMERVDVVELEPAITHVARVCARINQDVLANPKVHLYIGDGREFLLTTANDYDIIFSEPSNPYRAGVASLFSQDFYKAVIQRLRPGGIFLQWLQGYELDSQVVRTAYATLGSVFPAVESWQVHRADLLLMASREPVVHDLDRVRARVAQEPYRTALTRIWGVEGAEGFYTGFLATPSFAQAVRKAEGDALNTDDRPILEFGFARNLGRFGLFRLGDLYNLVKARHEDRPANMRGAPLDWSRVGELRVARAAYWEELFPDPEPQGDRAARLR